MKLASAASPRLTLLAIACLAAGVSWYAADGGASRAWVVAPLGLMAANLLAAIATNRAFRRELPLMAFHLALLAIVALAAAGQLSRLTGRVELAHGEEFAGELLEANAGPLHAGGLSRVRFVNEGFSIRYAPEVKRAETRNPVRVVTAEGTVERRVIGDTEPLRLGGYRFYTSFNKGYSLVFRWQPDGRAAERGVVNLPSYPLHEHRQALDWRLPEGPAVWTMLHLDRRTIEQTRESWFSLPETHHVVLRAGEGRWEMHPGTRVALPGGALVYEGLSTWMGYNVFYDWTLPWLLAASLVAMGMLGWHFARKLAREPWDA